MAEPRLKTRERFAATHNVDSKLVFKDWKELVAASDEALSTVGKRLADAVLVSVQDHMHAEVTAAFASQGYHILCEKPMATTIEDCQKIQKAVNSAGIIFGMGHGRRHCH